MSTTTDDGDAANDLVSVTGRLAGYGCDAALRNQLELLRDRSREMAGCLSFDLYQDGNEPRRFVSIERWESLEEMAQALLSHDWTPIQVLMDDPIDGWALRPI